LKDEFLEVYASAARIAPTLPQDQQGVRQTKDTPSSTSQLITISPSTNFGAIHVSTPHSVDRLTSMDTTLPWNISGSATNFISTKEHVEASDIVGSSEDYHQSNSPTPPRSEASTTTLCTTAFSLVLGSNRKDYSAADLDAKLRMGYRFSATPLEGCRVDNHVLLEVLAEIS
jgi:hypothetical protein